MTNIKNNAATQETRRKLIEAAGEVFAAQGLHAATIKEITSRAGVNSAAINYHFRDKFELYAAVVRYALDDMRHEETSPEKSNETPEQRLRARIFEMFEQTGDQSRPSWCTTILAHEFAQPTAALDAVVEESTRMWSSWTTSFVRFSAPVQRKSRCFRRL
jgi:AcrR family transcriptional regulator